MYTSIVILHVQSASESMIHAHQGFIAICMNEYCCEYLVELDPPKYTLQYGMLNIGGCEVEFEEGACRIGMQVLSLSGLLSSFPSFR